mmetsp:Transcript_2786/g.5802  ORF Transcript_2786/g.5802 Transcript_2786/m.5802 type:complete len:272 (+) Transcript_2786:93-908(+)
MAPPSLHGYCDRLRHELSRPCASGFCDLLEPDGETVIDPGLTFSPHGPVVLAWRITVLVLVVSALAVELNVGKPLRVPFFSYLTNTSYLLCCVYFVSSLSCSLAARAFGGVRAGAGMSAAATPLEKASWILFAVVQPGEILLTVLFWTLIYSPSLSLDFFTFMSHGVLVPLVAIDGWVVGRIPLRAPQFLFSFLYHAGYVVWTFIHMLINKNDYDYIYHFVNWKESPSAAATMLALLLFIAFPLVFLLCWTLSTLVPKRYIIESETNLPEP